MANACSVGVAELMHCLRDPEGLRKASTAVRGVSVKRMSSVPRACVGSSGAVRI